MDVPWKTLMPNTGPLRRNAVLHLNGDVVALPPHILMRCWAQHLRPDSTVWPYHTYRVWPCQHTKNTLVLNKVWSAYDTSPAFPNCLGLVPLPESWGMTLLVWISCLAQFVAKSSWYTMWWKTSANSLLSCIPPSCTLKGGHLLVWHTLT